ncbi:ethanolamine permease [Brevibacterium casei]|uniref:Amino acid transporter n=2 Tax=Brevibacterium casei TaxID=33889 RepID=K9AU01_9MICO|nr:ethanolamine permease [Brevibacterium casei]EKU46092.1 amino acid transporter [Brevibacterium casei S18]MBE4693173.1 ethanolamine permease [Brevibacterium casei]MBY3576296.1 ethanolamine permease [Brevibacterium casei]MCT2182087.1 ethanolamine permease [Brevibacterium casei]MDH5147865.1 ethanolamine permease [Brevibacterium casei]
MSKNIEYGNVDENYLEKRQLKKGAAGWILLAGLGVAYVISGDFSGWNLGLAEGGWGGLLIAFLLMGLMYVCMVFGLAELSSTLPTAGAGYGFARRALGPLGGFATGMAILIEYTMAPAAISTFIAGYVQALGILPESVPTWTIYLAAYAIFAGVHLWGVGEALRLMFVITAIAVIALIVFVVAAVGHFDAANLFDIEPTTALGSSAFLPMGFSGLLASLVFGIWFFLAIEGVPLAAEESADPKRDMPRGIITAMAILVVFGALMLLLVPGIAGSAAMGESDNPLPEALRFVYGENSWLATFVNWAGLAGLIASFFSIIFAYSRQLFALSRAGYLPKWLSLTGKRKTPVLALIVPGTIGFLIAVLSGGNGGVLLNVAVFGATVSYVLLNLSHIRLRFKEPDLPRGYRTPGGVVTTGIALVLASVAVVATFFVDILAAAIAAGVFLIALAYFWFYSRHHLVASAPEEEFAQIEAAESELK